MAIPSGRAKNAFQTSMNWAALRDNLPLYFGDDFDGSITWNTGTSTLDIVGATSFTGAWTVAGVVTIVGDVNVSGGDVALSDTVRLEIGDTKTIYLVSSADVSALSDSMMIVGLPSSDTGASGALFTSDTDTLLHITA